MTPEERKNCKHTKTTFSPLSGGSCCDDCGFMIDPFASGPDDDTPLPTPAWAAPVVPAAPAPLPPIRTRTADYPLGDPVEEPAVVEEPAAVATGTATEWLDCTHIGPIYETQTRLVRVRGGAAVQEYRHRLIEVEITETHPGLRSWRLLSNKPWVKGQHKTMRGRNPCDAPMPVGKGGSGS